MSVRPLPLLATVTSCADGRPLHNTQGGRCSVSVRLSFFFAALSTSFFSSLSFDSLGALGWITSSSAAFFFRRFQLLPLVAVDAYPLTEASYRRHHHHLVTFHTDVEVERE